MRLYVELDIDTGGEATHLVWKRSAPLSLRRFAEKVEIFDVLEAVFDPENHPHEVDAQYLARNLPGALKELRANPGKFDALNRTGEGSHYDLLVFLEHLHGAAKSNPKCGYSAYEKSGHSG